MLRNCYVAVKVGARRGSTYRVAFTDLMGARLEAMASRQERYVPSFIREIVEAFVVSHESDRCDEDVSNDILEENLRTELIALNEALIKIESRRGDVQYQLTREVRKREDGFIDDELEDIVDEDEDDVAEDVDDFDFESVPPK